MRIKKYLMALALGLTMLCPTAVQAQRMQINFGPNSPLRKLQIAEMAINNLYVDSVNEQKLVEDGIRGMLEKLDPHSSYSSAKEAKALSESLNGSFEGIGVQFNIQSDTLLVIQPVSKGPSEKVGIMAGDRIVSVNDTAIAGVKMPQEEIMKRLRGPKGTHVKLGIVRRGIAGTLFFDVVRDKIPVKTLDAFYMIKPHVGYIRIGSFGATTYDEFMTAVNTLKGQGMKDFDTGLGRERWRLSECRSGHCQRVLEEERSDRLHDRPPGAQRGIQGKRQRTSLGRKGDCTRQRVHGLSSRDRHRCHTRPGSRVGRRPPQFRQRPCAASYTLC